MWEIWDNQLMPKALKSGPKSNKSPDPVTLPTYTFFLHNCSNKSCQRIVVLKAALSINGGTGPDKFIHS